MNSSKYKVESKRGVNGGDTGGHGVLLTRSIMCGEKLSDRVLIRADLLKTRREAYCGTEKGQE